MCIFDSDDYISRTYKSTVQYVPLYLRSFESGACVFHHLIRCEDVVSVMVEDVLCVVEQRSEEGLEGG